MLHHLAASRHCTRVSQVLGQVVRGGGARPWGATRLCAPAPSSAATAATAQQQHLATAMAEPAPSPTQQVHVRMPSDGKSLTISLVAAGKQRNLNRDKDEPLQKAFFRLRASIQPAPAKDKKRKKKAAANASEDPPAASSTDEPGLPIMLFRDAAATQPISEDTLHVDAWPAAALLVVGEERFQVQVNAPYAEKVALPRRPMAGFPMLAAPQLEFAQPEQCRWSWARRASGSEEWQVLECSEQVYTPSAQDVGCQLRVTCTPAALSGSQLMLGQPVWTMSDAVEAAPAITSAHVRLQVAAAAAAPGTAAAGRLPAAPAPAFRILSYNLLADQYAGSTYAQEVLFDYCPPAALDPDYRCQLILQELTAYNTDVMCLQEVDARLFREYLVPLLRRQGYEGHFTNKQGKVREGSATFWRTARFRHLLSYDIKLRDVFKQPLAPAHAQWQPMLDASPELVHALQKVTTIAQASLLVPVGQGEGTQPLCVVNTHLFFHPYAPHIRTMHTAAILEEVHALLTQLAQPAISSAAVPPLPPGASSAEADATPQAVGTHSTHGQQSGPQAQARLQATGGDDATQPAARAAGGDEVSTSEVEHLSGVVLESSTSGSTQHTQQLARVAGQLAGRPRPTVLLCGDLNSDLNDGTPGVIELLQRGSLRADHWDWRMGANFRWGMNEEDGDPEQQAAAPHPPRSAIAAAVAAAQAATPAAPGASDGNATQEAPAAVVASNTEQGGVQVTVVGIDVQVPYALRSCDDLSTPFTNYTSGYKALLDYVWYQPQHLQVVQCMPVPNEQQLGSFIPSPIFPSDHLAVVYDLHPVKSANQ